MIILTLLIAITTANAAPDEWTQISPSRAFSTALAMRRYSKTPDTKLFAEYQIARALERAGQTHSAFSAYSVIAAAPFHNTEIKTAALTRLAKIHSRYPSLALPVKIPSQIDEFEWAAFLSSLPGNNILRRLQDPALATAAAGVTAAKKSDYTTVINKLEPLLKTRVTHPALKRIENQLRLILARAYYSTARFDEGTKQLLLIPKNSNELAKALSELSWHYLLNEKYSEAIGTTISMQAGGLRRTFTPETLMVMAMALNELCQYPESLSAISTFRRNYEKTYFWLKNWSSTNDPLYPLAVQYLRKQAQLPDRIGSEWVRSPVFIANQDEINLLFESRDAAASLSRSAAREHRAIGANILKLANELKLRIRAARTKLKPGMPLPTEIKEGIAALKSELLLFKRFQTAAPVWKTVLSKHEQQIPRIKSRLVAEINSDLARRNRNMLTRLDEIAENNQLIEVEIYNGASKDIIWQNAHPEYKEMAKKFNDDENKESAAAVWDWGRSPAALSDDAGEIWEDELGSFKARLFDNCGSKDRYLAIKRGRNS